ncbi:patatin-like phospholipase family protein [Agaribacterium haliotis]|uniref:patatin-like phospholipase family protein n=1 Tax=Agaribacterium haliotis TaxID=2013869 RepID=UPI000BB586EB|nr:patatin-like phospholipase family protein [Agaribacterium haliotis]
MPGNALILSGGGARAAYQVGVLLGVSDILPHLKNPFEIISGTSAGAINAASLAAHPGSFNRSAHDLAAIWRELEPDSVFRSNLTSLLSGAANVGFSLLHGGSRGKKPLALLDNSPLRETLSHMIDFRHIQRKIDKGKLKALSVTALGYSSGESVSFFQGQAGLKGWRRYRRVGTPATISVEHLLASSAIPVIFPTLKLSMEYFGDGAMRQMAPISSALHLGANRVFIIGVSGNRAVGPWGRSGKFVEPENSPSLAQILGQMMNAAFIDSLEGDIEHLERVNDLLRLVPEKAEGQTGYLREVDTLIISPTKRLDRIAARKIKGLPKTLRFFLRSSGASAKGGGAAAASYLLFTREYCNELIELGYNDAMWDRDKIEAFFNKG